VVRGRERERARVKKSVYDILQDHKSLVENNHYYKSGVGYVYLLPEFFSLQKEKKKFV
jgi:spore coat polysaccharide biosynthesis predicted glycosyltransferase SpsG